MQRSIIASGYDSFILVFRLTRKTHNIAIGRTKNTKPKGENFILYFYCRNVAYFSFTLFETLGPFMLKCATTEN